MRAEDLGSYVGCGLQQRRALMAFLGWGIWDHDTHLAVLCLHAVCVHDGSSEFPSSRRRWGRNDQREATITCILLPFVTDGQAKMQSIQAN